MLRIIKNIDDNTVEQLFSIYSESMAVLRKNFGSDSEMRSSYASFLIEFIANPKQLILIEDINGEWVSCLRAVETAPENWFIEAVETKPEERKKGYGMKLLLHTISYLEKLGMKEITSTILKDNFKSQALHEKCGFVPTNDPPINAWNELEEGTILYRYRK